jgi:hypothetical protein
MDKAETITASRMAQLLSVTPKTICELAKRDVLVKGKKRGTYLLSMFLPNHRLLELSRL